MPELVKVGDDRQLVGDPLDHHGFRLDQLSNTKLLSSFKGQFAVVLDIMLCKSIIGYQIRIKAVNESTKCKSISPTRGKICYLDIGIT